MGKGQYNKPDCVQEPYTEAMWELAAGIIGDNVAGLAGELKKLEEVTQLCGLRFNGYLAKVETPRQSGVADEVMVAFTGDRADTEEQRGGMPIREYLADGSRVIVSGRVQTLKDFKSGRVLVFILADFLGKAKNPMMQNNIALRGIIAHDPVCRATPRGRRIADISVIVKNELTGNRCFVPCICWEEHADAAAGWQRGDTVELLGRYQSRQYEKKIPDSGGGNRERRTAYEVSAQWIRRKDRAGG